MKKSIVWIYMLMALKSFGIEYTIPTREEVAVNADKVVAWQQQNFSYSTTSNLHDNGIASWTHATWYKGLAAWAATKAEESYDTWLLDIGEKANWTPAANFKNSVYSLYHADEFCIGQFFVSMYRHYGESRMLASTIERLDWVLSNPPNESMSASNKQSWTWCDALFMAPPVYAQIARETGDDKYLAFMDQEFRKTYDYLFDQTEHLFFRDDSYFSKQEANGKKVFWGRGNGWSIAGIANILDNLPETSEYRPYYEGVFRKLALSLINLEDKEGGWHASLLDPDSYPAVETSATALITYALTYGLNHGLLTESEALRPVLKAWNKLCSAIQDNGKLGWVQPIGQDPKTITANMTSTFGVGAFLLTASELYKLLENEIDPVPEIEFMADAYSLKTGSCVTPGLYLLDPVRASDVRLYSSDPSVVEVSGSGTLCARREGEAIITAVYHPDPDVTATCRVVVSEASYPENLFFDFGSSSSAVSEGALKVSSQTFFSTNGPYGWLSTAGLGERYLSRPADNVELRGFIACRIPAVFKVLLKNGTYRVTATQGDADYPHEYMSVKANGVVMLEDITSEKGSYEVNTFTCDVTGNMLELEFSKEPEGDPNWVVNSLKINYLSENTGLSGSSSPEGFHGQHTSVSIYNISGQKLYETALSGKTYRQILTECACVDGLYLIRMQSDRKVKTVKCSNGFN